VTDNCPECATGPARPTASRTGDRQHTDHYRCPRRGHVWFTTRAVEPEPDRSANHDDPDAWEADDDPPPYDPQYGERPW
jgi:hypothetical protein